MTTITNIALGKTDIFEVVESIPAGYEIWNIGTNMKDGWLPIAKFENYHMVPGTLKAVKCDGAQIILKALGFGPDDIKSMTSYVKRYSHSKNAYTLKKVARCEEALEVMKTLTWN